ncbi:MAG: LamG-like jellyroll fold domain-containing protein [Acidobacteriota bacterium]
MKNMNRFRKLFALSMLVCFALASCATNFYRAAQAQGGAWETKASAPMPITGHAVGVVNAMLYSVGGESGQPCCNNFGAPTFAYDPATNTWTTKTGMSVRRKNLAAGVVNSILYAVGGDNDFSHFGTNEAYNPATDSWAARANMPTPRSFHAVGAVNGIIYAAGGSSASGVLATVESYDPGTDTWDTKASMLQARQQPASAVVNGTLYVIGGFDNSSGSLIELATVEAYDPATNTWTSKAPMPTARHALAASAVNGIIYAIGGFNGGALATVEAYDPATNTWTTMPPLPMARHSLAAGEINGALYAVGGRNSSNTVVATVESFTPPPDTCVPPPSGLVSWWPGDGDANDIEDSNNGTLLGGAAFAAGHVGQAFSFDGVNGRVLVPSAANLDLQQAFTIDTWVNFADLNSAHCIVCKGTVNNHQYALLTGDLAALDELELLVRRQASASDGPDRLITVNQAHLVPNRWYHIVATADGTNKSIYLDGQLLATNSAVAPYTTFSPAVEIGSGNGGTVAFFHGLIDEVNIYNRALSGAEIRAIFNAGSAGKCRNRPPVADAGPDQMESVGSGCQATVALNATGSTDPDGDFLTYVWSEGATQLGTGSTLIANLGAGSHTITLTTTDPGGASDQDEVIINVVDSAPPAITCPTNITVTANLGSSSVAVSYPAPTASDNCAVASIVCSPASGSVFPIGATTVTCAATDSSDNTASCAFIVTVLSPQQAAQLLINSVNDLVSQGAINEGQGNSLTSKLDAAIEKMDQGNGNAARNQLEAFINQVNDLMNSGGLSASQGQALIDAANNLIAHIP